MISHQQIARKELLKRLLLKVAVLLESLNQFLRLVHILN
jgi:hypothetical protein